MRYISIFIILLFFPIPAQAQSMDEKIKILSSEIADQVVKSGNKKVAVTTLDYKDCTTEFGKTLAEDLTGYLSVSGRDLSVVNQKLLNSLLEQNKLTAKGLLEAKNDASKLGQVSGINALVYGTITTINEEIRISVSIVKLPTLEVFGFTKTSFPLTNGIKDMLACSNSQGGVTPLVPGTDPDKKCAINHTGTYCFQNETSTDIRVTFSGGDFTIHPKQSECNYGVHVGSQGERAFTLFVYKNTKEHKFEKRQLVVSECQIKTYVVR